MSKSTEPRRKRHEKQVESPDVQAEQARIAQLLHDSLAQSLTGIYLKATVLARTAAGASPQLAADIAELRELVHGAAEELHGVIRSLRSEGE